MKDSLIVSEKFTSIQGEGVTTGVPSVFLRLAGCNLLCKSASWVCDSIEVWQKGVPFEFKNVFTEKELINLREGYHLVITGGEPLLHQASLIEFLNWFKMYYDFIPYIEIETNGTIRPFDEFKIFVSQWNCSPKLSSSGELNKKRLNQEALEIISKEKNSWFKFVVSSFVDVEEIENDFHKYIKKSQVILMPAGETQEKLNETRGLVSEMCIQGGYRYSDRLHIVIWNQKTGV